LLFAPVGRKKEPAAGRGKTASKTTIMTTVKERKKRAGRPAKTVKKDVRAAVRFTRPEYFILKEKAAKAGMTPSSYIRQIAIHALVSTRLTDEERHFVRQLIGMANNLNQLAKCCHQEGALKAMIYFRDFLKQLDALLKKLQA
jgi:predicted DNA binding CopG/RHH family protein